MWTPNSVQVPKKLVIDCLSTTHAPEVLLAVAAFMMFPKMTPENLSEEYQIPWESVDQARMYLLTESSKTVVKEESPSTETVEEEPSQGSSFREEFPPLVRSFFPDAEVTEERLTDIEKNSDGDLGWCEDALTIIHAGHLEKNNVYDPVGLVGWWIAKQPRDQARNRAESVRRKPKSQGSILGETLARAKQQAPPKPGPTPEKIEAMKRRNEAARGKAE